jgi:hypothetical protein
MPLLEDLPIDEKVRRANVLVKTRPRDVEESLLELINDDDQIVAASSIDLAARPRSGAWPTTSSTCWPTATSATGTSSRRRRGRWPSGGCPPSGAASCGSSRCRPPNSPGRLRALPMFASVTVDELFRIAGSSRQVRHDPAPCSRSRGALPSSCTSCSTAIVVRSCRRAAAARRGAGGARPGREPCRACRWPRAPRRRPRRDAGARRSDELRTLLADNTDLVAGSSRRWRPGVVRRLRPHAAVAAGPPNSNTTAATRCCRREGPRLRTRPAVLAGVRPRGAPPRRHRAQRPADGRPDAVRRIGGAGDLDRAVGRGRLGPEGIGAVTRAPATSSARSRPWPGSPIGQAATVTRDGVALRIDRDDLFDLLGERPALLRQLFCGDLPDGGAATGSDVGYSDP